MGAEGDHDRQIRERAQVLGWCHCMIPRESSRQDFARKKTVVTMSHSTHAVPKRASSDSRQHSLRSSRRRHACQTHRNDSASSEDVSEVRPSRQSRPFRLNVCC